MGIYNLSPGQIFRFLSHQFLLVISFISFNKLFKNNQLIML